MRFEVRVKVPDYRLELPNEEDVIRGLATELAARVRDRTERGEGARGALPQPKEGGRPLRETGSLIASIGVVMRQRRGRWIGVVRPVGPRSELAEKNRSRDVTKSEARLSVGDLKRKRARERTRALRNSFRSSLGADHGLSEKAVRRAIGRIRRRTVVDQGSLMAILASPPRDRRAQAGGRAIYNVFEARLEEQSELRAEAARRLVARLEKHGELVKP